MKKIYKDKKGSSLVFALIAMSFVALLAVAVITMTVTNIRLKDAAKNSQKTLYSADGILDSIKAGIQDLSSQSSASAYKKSLSSYSKVLSGGTTSVKEIYDAAYLKEMVKSLSGVDVFDPSNSAYEYKDDVIRNYLDAVQVNSYKSHPGGKGEMIYDNGTLVLKDIEVSATRNSYKTHITTDIHIDIPAMTTETNSEYLGYAMIADNQIKANPGGTDSVVGSVYAGTVGRDASDKDSDKGICVYNGATLSIQAENIISRGDISINGNSSLFISGDGSEPANVWVENIVTGDSSEPDKSGGNVLSIDGDCNVSDDLSIDGEKDSVTLSGGYFGYNYNDNYDDAGAGNFSNLADYSSAVLINAKDSSLNMAGLNNLVLAGRSFISKNSGSENYAGTTKPVKNKDIMTGESLTMKASQIAYLVAGDYWEEVTDMPITKVDTIQKAIYFSYANDLGSKNYVFRYGDYMESMGLKNVNLLDYIDVNNPLAYYYRYDENVKKDGKAVEVKYFYLNFKSNEKSSEFYEALMNTKDNSTKDDIISLEKRYVSNTVGIKLGSAIIMSSGNVLYKDGTNDTIEIKPNTTEPISKDSGLAIYARTKSKEYMSRQLSLIDDYDVALQSTMWRLASDPSSTLSKNGVSDKTNLFDMLIQRSKLPSSGEERSNIEGGLIAISSGDFTWDDSERGRSEYGGCEKGIIIAEGDVTLMRDFKGLIIAGGDITFGATGIKAEADQDLVTKMFAKDKDSASPLFYDRFTKYFKKIVDSTISSDSVKSRENVQYENWKRN